MFSSLLASTALVVWKALESCGRDSRRLFEVGLDVRHPLNMTLRGRQMNLSGYAIYWLYTDLEFIRATEVQLDTTQQFEIGLTLGAETPVSFLGFTFDRVGPGYRFGDDFSAMRLMGSFPY